jgi:hypothetical protein
VTRSHTRIESQKEGGEGSGTKTTDWDEEELEYQSDEEGEYKVEKILDYNEKLRNIWYRGRVGTFRRILGSRRCT